MCFLTSAPTTLAEAAAMTSATASSSSGALADEVPINLILKAGVDRTGTEKWMLDSNAQKLRHVLSQIFESLA
jgi:hypothetical protein